MSNKAWPNVVKSISDALTSGGSTGTNTCTHKGPSSKEFPDGYSLFAGHFQVACTGCGEVQKDDPRILVEPTRYESLLKMESDQNEIVEYLRLQYKQEIERGDHSGMSFPEVIVKYLARERRTKGAFLWRIFK